VFVEYARSCILTTYLSNGTSDMMKSIWKQNGYRGFYRGLGPTILGYLPTWGIYFAVYDGIKAHFGEPPLGGVKPRDRIYPAAQVKGYQPVARQHPWGLHIFSAVAAGATSTICTNPLWVIKTRFMVRRYFLLTLQEGSTHARCYFRLNPQTKSDIVIPSTLFVLSLNKRV
jgi:solute carrier family 25 (mitochondrial folate transporter), member 32